jgi:hypothetical protein
MDPRQDEEAGVVHDQVQSTPALLARPTDELNPGDAASCRSLRIVCRFRLCLF